MNYPGIPAVTSDQELAATVRALVEAVELLTGQRGDGTLKAVTKLDLHGMGLVATPYNQLTAQVSRLETRHNEIFGKDLGDDFDAGR